MTPLHLVRTAVDRVALFAFAARTGTLDDDLGYALHLALRRRFDAAAPQPFRRMEPPPHGHANEPDRLLGYVADPTPLLSPDSAPPDPLGSWQEDEKSDLQAIFPAPFEAKSMPKNWRAGQRLAFEVLVRPVRRHGPQVRAARQAEGKASGVEHDAFLSAVESLQEGARDLTRESVYAGWLSERLAGAAELDWTTGEVQRQEWRRMRPGQKLPPELVETEPLLRAFRRTRLWRSVPGKGGRGRGGRGIEHPEALLAGTLVVADPARFHALLTHGIGRHTAFGFGMLLLRPPQQGT